LRSPAAKSAARIFARTAAASSGEGNDPHVPQK